jgi:alcohol dehydrogenase class IV
MGSNAGSSARSGVGRAFVYTAQARRVVFGSGTLAQAGAEAAALGITRALVLSTAAQADAAHALARDLGTTAAGVFADATMHTPVDVTERALAQFDAVQADGVIALGGGSTIGLGKALALRTDCLQLAIPTTYAGSEMTDILGETQDGEKRTRRSPRVVPECVIYDVDLTLTLPVALSVTSGANAMAHAVESLYAPDTNPLLGLMAEDGVRALARGLTRVIGAPMDAEGRHDALYGAWLCGLCLGAATMGLHHKLCHALGGLLDLPHAETHAVLLPHTLAYNSDAAPAAMARIARALGVAAAAPGLYALMHTWHAPRSLRELGMPETAIDAAADAAVRSPYANPRPVERAAIRALLARAWAGSTPAP